MVEMKQNVGNNNGAMQKFNADAVIMREGERCGAMYKVLSGSVVLYMRYGEQNEHIVGIYSKQRCFGELNLFSEQPCIYTAVAYDDVLLMKITKDSVEQFIVNNPRNAVDIMTSMVQSFHVMQKNVELLLDDVYAKDRNDRKRTTELKDKIMQYSIRGQALDRFW